MTSTPVPFQPYSDDAIRNSTDHTFPPFPAAAGPPVYPLVVAPVPVAAGTHLSNASFAKDDSAAISVRETPRTPSPTPSEARVLSETARLKDFKRVFDWRWYARNRRRLTNLLVVLGVIAFIGTFVGLQSKIEDALRPLSGWLHDTPGAWLIPIAAMIIVSFPPLLGHEVIAIIVGDVWGLGVGFAIVAAGTILGELANFIAFKYYCGARGRKLEEKQLSYALYSEVVREGGLSVPIIMRFSLIPGHLTTAVFATSGMEMWRFLVAAIFGLPKQLAAVYFGDSETSDGSLPTTGVIVKVVVILVAVVTTFAALVYIHRRRDRVKERVIYARRKSRQAKILLAAEETSPPYVPSNTGISTTSSDSRVKIPLGTVSQTSSHVLHIKTTH